jgi:hypothetical protein
LWSRCAARASIGSSAPHAPVTTPTSPTLSRLSDATEGLARLVLGAPTLRWLAEARFLAELKADPGSVGLKTPLAEIEKLDVSARRVPVAIAHGRSMMLLAGDRE